MALEEFSSGFYFIFQCLFFLIKIGNKCFVSTICLSITRSTPPFGAVRMWYILSVCTGCSPPDTWTPPGGWNGSLPVVYRSFDTLHCLQEMEGAVPSQFGALVTGKV